MEQILLEIMLPKKVCGYIITGFITSGVKVDRISMSHRNLSKMQMCSHHQQMFHNQNTQFLLDPCLNKTRSERYFGAPDGTVP